MRPDGPGRGDRAHGLGVSVIGAQRGQGGIKQEIARVALARELQVAHAVDADVQLHAARPNVRQVQVALDRERVLQALYASPVEPEPSLADGAERRADVDAPTVRGNAEAREAIALIVEEV